MGRLTGLVGAELARLLGQPVFRRVDEPAALWQYRSRDCILDIFLYADGRDYRVTHFEFRQRGDTPHKVLDRGDAERCFSNMAPAKAGIGDKG
jgi:hypothetical protein